MTTKHTPGPWRLETWTYDNGARKVPTIQNDTDAVATMLDLWCMDTRADEAAANARLIAAAPELLEALQLAQATLDRLQPQHTSTQGTHDVIAAAIAKATGAQP